MNLYLKIIIPVFVLVVLLFVLFRPVCVEITDEDLKRFDPPIETRTDKNFYLKSFQKKEGKWYQCKTWISRKFFF
ncbi:MAG: hypothetical protein GWM89_12190 [Candidatus Dadabacteria bacterium]|nr:hypothetical protein [Candidatus Dadabacteria bacterium]NIX16600.1 hypothetical protein [Candidatus Dadabacteria bacterium]NIY23147.1 hypothetical protein [Candidatus Dadabacteria bacterium]